MRITAKATLIVGAVALVPALLPLPFVLPSYAEALLTSAQQSELVLAKELQSKVDGHVGKTTEDARTVAAAVARAATAKDDALGLATVDLVLATRAHIDVARLVIPAGNVDTVLGKADADRSLAPRATPEMLARARQDGIAYEILDDRTAAIVVPIPMEAAPPSGGSSAPTEGYIVAPLYLQPLSTALADLAESRSLEARGSEVLVVDRQRRVLASFGGRERPVLSDASDACVLSLLPQRPTLGSIGVTGQCEESGKSVVGAAQTMDQTPWTIAIIEPRERVLADYERTRRRLVLSACGAVAVALLLALVAARSVTRPVLALAAQARRISARKWRDLVVPPKRSDEIGTLEGAMVTMAGDLERQERKIADDARMRADLVRFLSPEVALRIEKGELDMALGGKRTEVTVLFADVVGFTPLAERREAEETVAILNELFGLLTEIVFRHGGLVDKFIGDSIMAVFGAPEPQPDHAARALRAAEDIMRFLETASETFRQTHDVQIRLAIGVNSGVAVVGNIGSERRMDYTAIGDAVNLAARLETLASPNQVLVGASTAELVGDAFELTRLGERAIPGRDRPAVVYELVV